MKPKMHVKKVALILTLLVLAGCAWKTNTRLEVFVPPMPQSLDRSTFDFHFRVKAPIDGESTNLTSYHWAAVEFEINENGTTENIQLIDTSDNERFGEVSIEYVSGLQLYPHFDNWKINERRKNKAILEFNLLDTRKSPPKLRVKIFRDFEHARIASEQKEYDVAAGTLDQIEKDIGWQEYYAKLQLYNFRAFLEFSKGNYQKAKEYYRIVAIHPSAPIKLKVSTLHILAQLEFITNEYKSSLNYLLSWDAIAGSSKLSVEMFKARILIGLKDKGAAKWVLDRALLNPRTENMQRLENAKKLQESLNIQRKKAISLFNSASVIIMKQAN